MSAEKTTQENAAQEPYYNLITRMHETFGDTAPSDQHRHLMQQLEWRIHPKGAKEYGEPVPLETLEQLVEDMEAEHPKTAAAMREILETLKNIGV